MQININVVLHDFFNKTVQYLRKGDNQMNTAHLY